MVPNKSSIRDLDIQGPWGRPPPINLNNKMFEKSKWYSLLGVNAMLTFILET